MKIRYNEFQNSLEQIHLLNRIVYSFDRSQMGDLIKLL